MAVQGVKGTGIGQVVIPSAEEILREREGYVSGIGEAAAPYLEGIMGRGEKADQFLSPIPTAEQIFGTPETRIGAASQFLTDIPLTALEGLRQVTGGISAVTDPTGNVIGDYLSSPTDAQMAKIIQEEAASIESELAPFRRAVSRSQEEFPEAEKEPEQTEPSSDTTTEEYEKASGISEGQGVAAPTAKATDADIEELTTSAIQDYLNQVRPGVTPKDTAEYMKEFAEATGLDVSGKPDKSSALMALGLSLMQNKAGSGFDVRNILSAVGEAGTKAMPAFEKAKSEARALRAKAGEYALSRKKEDQAIAQKRDDFYVIPKGSIGGPLGVVDAITKGKGEFVRLNAYELQGLDENEDFNNQYEIVKGSDYTDLVKEAIKAPEVKDKYLGSSTKVPLYTGSKVELQVQLPDRNVSSDAQAVLLTPVNAALNQINSMELGLASGEKTFQNFANLMEQTNIDVPSQARAAVVTTLRNFGINVGEGPDPVKLLQTALEKFQAKSAAEILGESGKTLSDNDRRMVKDIVGDISLLAGDEALLLSKLEKLYDDVIGTRRNEINEAYKNLESYGVNFNRGNTAQSGTGFTLGDDGVYRRATQ